MAGNLRYEGLLKTGTSLLSRPVEEDTPVRAIPSVIILALSLIVPAVAASQDAAVKEDLARDPAVRESQMPEPTAQGIRSPEPLPTSTDALSPALAQVENVPLNVDGQPVPRPNGLSSLPDKFQAAAPAQQ